MLRWMMQPPAAPDSLPPDSSAPIGAGLLGLVSQVRAKAGGANLSALAARIGIGAAALQSVIDDGDAAQSPAVLERLRNWLAAPAIANSAAH